MMQSKSGSCERQKRTGYSLHDPYINNVALGKYGRNRTTVWTYEGLAQFGKGRQQALEDHPTVKNVALVMDAVLDVTHRGTITIAATVTIQITSAMCISRSVR